MHRPQLIRRGFARGLNLRDKPYGVTEDQVSLAQNFFYDGSRLVKRSGSSRLNVSPFAGGGSAGKFITRFYGTGTPTLVISVANSSVIAMDDTGATTLLVGGSGFVDPVTDMVTFLGSLYFTNGEAPIQLTSDLATITDNPINEEDRRGKYMEVFQERLFIAGDPNDPDTVYYSNILDPTTFPLTNTITLDFDEGDEVTGMAKLGIDVADSSAFGVLCIFTLRTIYILVNSRTINAPVYRPNKMSAVGTKAPLSIVSTPYGILFFGSEGGRLGVFLFDGTNVTRVSGTVDSEFEGMSDLQVSNVAAVHHEGFYKLYYGAEGSPVNNRELWLDVGFTGQNQTAWWGPHTGRNINHGVVGLGRGDSGQLWAVDSSLGFVYVMETGVQDHDQDVIGILETRDDDMSSPELSQFSHEAKKFIELRLSSDTPGELIRVETIIDDLVVDAQNLTFLATGAVFDQAVFDVDVFGSEDVVSEVLDIRRVGERIRFRIQHPNTFVTGAQFDTAVFDTDTFAQEQAPGAFILNDYGIRFAPHRAHTVIRR